MGQTSMRKWRDRAWRSVLPSRQPDADRSPEAVALLALRMRREFRQERRVERALRNGKRYDFRNVVVSIGGVEVSGLRSVIYDSAGDGAFRPISVGYRRWTADASMEFVC